MLGDILITPIGLEHATIRDNIIFGSSAGFDESRYMDVLNACSLNRDLDALDFGDLTGTYVVVLCTYLIMF